MSIFIEYRNCMSGPYPPGRMVEISADILSAMLKAADQYMAVAQSAADQWGDDYLWEKWGLDRRLVEADQMASRARILAFGPPHDAKESNAKDDRAGSQP